MPLTSGILRYLVPLLLISGLGIIFLTIPPAVMDVMIAGNLTLAVLVLMTSVTVSRPIEFSVFPAILLIATILRLFLNVATTRMILTAGPADGVTAAGSIIAAFGHQVTGEQLVVGLIIFVILAVVQIMVVTQGAARISEVAARFTLDGLPGRQMTIDADLAAGAIDKQEAHRRRQELVRQTDFFGAMDGASKFLRGDAMAGVMITIVNLAGGLFRGVVQQGLPLDRAVEVYCKLTIGDGLASQIPSVLTSLAAGLLIARCSERTDFSRDVVMQTLVSREKAWFVAIILLLLGLCGMPKLPLLILAAAVVLAAEFLSRAMTDANPDSPSTPSTQVPRNRTDDQMLAYDPVELELGLQLLPLAKSGEGDDLLMRMSQVRQRLANELGVIVPRIRVRDNLKLAPHEFCLKLMGNPVCQGRLYLDRLLAVASTPVVQPIPGHSARGLVSEMPQWWIQSIDRNKAESEGFRLLNPLQVLEEAAYRTIRRNADTMLTRDAVKGLLDSARKTVPAVVDEVSATGVSLGTLQRVLQALVREHVPLRQLPRILEAVCDCAGELEDAVEIANFVRPRLAGSISNSFRDRDHRIRCARISGDLELTLLEAVDAGFHLRPSLELQSLIRNFCRELERQTSFLKSTGLPQILLVPQKLRAHMAKWISEFLPDVIVLGDREISADTSITPIATVGPVTVAA